MVVVELCIEDVISEDFCLVDVFGVEFCLEGAVDVEMCIEDETVGLVGLEGINVFLDMRLIAELGDRKTAVVWRTDDGNCAVTSERG